MALIYSNKFLLHDCSKTSLMDPRFAPAWIAFAHTFTLEGEHDHAVTAYSTCVRMFTGYAPHYTFEYLLLTLTIGRVLSSHLPLTFVGMEHIILSNYSQADEAFLAANAMCDGDPLLANERGIMAYNYGE